MTGQRLNDAAVRGATVTIADIAHLPTVDVPTAGRVVGIGRDAAYAAAARGEIPTLKLGRSLRVPVPKLLELLGVTAAGGPAIDLESSEAGPVRPAAAEETPTPLKRLVY